MTIQEQLTELGKAARASWEETIRERDHYRALCERAAELLRNATNSGYMVYSWAKKREEWLKDAGIEEK